MAQPVVVQIVGAVAAQPSAPVLYTPALNDYLSLQAQATYGAVKSGAISISSPVTPRAIDFENIAFGRLFGLRVDSGVRVDVLVTYADVTVGTQRHIVSDELLLHSPVPGTEFTGIQLIGTGDIRYVLSGDVS